MGDFGNFASCMVDTGHGANGPKGVPGRALAASSAIEVATVAALLLWPLIAPAVLPPEAKAAPVPLFNGPLVPNSNRRQDAPNSYQRHRTITELVFHQPPARPVHIARSANANQAIADVIGDSISLGAAENGPLGIGAGGAATPIAPPGRVSAPRMISKVMDAFLIERVQPDYPRAAEMIGLSGTVQLRAVIGIDGRVRHLAVVSGNPILAQAAIAAVRQWRYEPTRLNGEPVEVGTEITVNFVFE
jgi:periplasmic protein TonB